jgi:hypothetical protein
VEKVVKRRVVKISLAILVVVGIALGLLLQLVCDRGPEMSFGFLDGKALTARIERDPGRYPYRTRRDVYSFEADFDDVCTKVKAELTALGFSRLMGLPESEMCQYRLWNNSSTERLDVRILNRNVLSAHSAPKSSEYSSPDPHEYHWRYGWVSVEIVRIRLRSWPPQYFLTRLHMMLRRNAKNPPPKK